MSIIIFNKTDSFVFQQLLSDVGQIFIGEHEANVADDVRQQLLELWVFRHVAFDGLADHRVLAHQDVSMTLKRRIDNL